MIARTNQRSGPATNRDWLLQSLENRIMLAGDVGAAVPASDAVDVAACVVSDNVVNMAAREIVFVDHRVPDLHVWLDNVSPNAELVLLSADQDPLATISSTIQNASKSGHIKSIHIVSHGESGKLHLADQVIDQRRLTESQEMIANWRHHLSSTADILIYGCDVAEGPAGEQFVKTLARLTGADIAASTDRTGNSVERASDWVLERHIGNIETHLVLDANAREQTTGTLDIVINAWGQTGEEQFNLLIDGQSVATFDAATTWTPFTYETNQHLDGSQVRVEFTNDFHDPRNGVERNLFVSNVQINGVNYESDAASTFSTGTWTAADGVQRGFGRGNILHANGYFQYGPDADTQSTITARVRGEQGGEEFQILNRGELVSTFTASTDLAEYTAYVDGVVSPNDVSVRFTNDLYQPDQGIDRNLIVDSVSVDGVLLESEAPTTFASGVYVEGEGIQSGFLQSEILHANGFFQYGGQPSRTGAIDQSYGDNGLVQVAAVPADMGIDADGNTLLISENISDQIFLTLVDSSGNNVDRFGGDGVVALADVLPNTAVISSATLVDIAAANDGGWIISSGQVIDNQFLEPQPLLFKVASTGNLDQTFGDNGIVSNHGLEIRTIETFPGPFRSADFDPIHVAVDSSGRVLLAGGKAGGTDRAVVRLQSNGQIDSTFANGGTAMLSVGDVGFFQQRELAIQNDGSIISVSSGGRGAWKLTETGATDTSYGTNGVAEHDVIGKFVAVDDFGRILDATNSQVARVGASWVRRHGLWRSRCL